MDLNYLKKILGVKFVEQPESLEQKNRNFLKTANAEAKRISETRGYKLDDKIKANKNYAPLARTTTRTNRVDEGVPIVSSQTSYSPAMELYTPTIIAVDPTPSPEPSYDRYSGGGGSFGGGGSSSSWDSGSSSSSSYDSGSSSSDSGSSSFSND